MSFFDEEEEYSIEAEKCKSYKDSLPKNKWLSKNKGDLKEGDFINVVYWTNSQRDMYTYKPLIGLVLKVILTKEISDITIRDQNNNETNIIKSGFGYGFHNESCCDMSIKVLSDIPDIQDNTKKRKNLENIDKSKDLKVDDSDELNPYYISDSD